MTGLPSETQDADPYEYDVLPSGDYIRYLTLRPGSADEPLICSLQITHFNDCPSFEAISYVWGSDERGSEVLCDGRKLMITQNLRDALRRVRLPSAPRALWADSICINQSDDSEKGHQVRLMGQIFSKSVRTLAYLGPDDRHGSAELAASIITEADNMIMTWFEGAQDGWNDFPIPDGNDPLMQDSRWEAVATLLERPWFYRGWVVQEVSLAPETQLLWGRAQVSWLSLMRVVAWDNKRSFILSGHIHFHSLQYELFKRRYKEYAKHFHRKAMWYTDDLVSSLHKGRALGFGDNRDRIYAFLGLPQAAEMSKVIEPDYSKNFLEVYLNFACQFLAHSPDIWLLHNVQHTEHSLKSSFPSWVPRWNLSEYRTGIVRQRDSQLWARDPTAFTPPVVLDRKIGVRGVIVDRIKATTKPMLRRIEVNEVASTWQRLKGHGLAEHATALLFTITITAGQYRGDFKKWLTSQKEYAQYLEDFDCRNVVPLSKEAQIVQRRVQSVSPGRRAAVTDRGYLTLVPNPTREGDLVCIVFGGKAPFIIRKADIEEEYRLVGTAAVGGKNANEIEFDCLGSEASKDWLDWGVEEQDIVLC